MKGEGLVVAVGVDIVLFRLNPRPPPARVPRNMYLGCSTLNISGMATVICASGVGARILTFPTAICRRNWQIKSGTWCCSDVFRPIPDCGAPGGALSIDRGSEPCAASTPTGRSPFPEVRIRRQDPGRLDRAAAALPGGKISLWGFAPGTHSILAGS